MRQELPKVPAEAPVDNKTSAKALAWPPRQAYKLKYTLDWQSWPDKLSVTMVRLQPCQLTLYHRNGNHAVSCCWDQAIPTRNKYQPSCLCVGRELAAHCNWQGPVMLVKL